MAKPEKVATVEETEDEVVEAPKASKKTKAEKKEAPKEVAVEAASDEVVYDKAWHEARAKEVDEALTDGNKFKALAKILEITTGVPHTKLRAEQAFNAVQQFIILNTYTQGVTRLPLLGRVELVDVPEKAGKIKTQGEEKAWVSPAHTTLKFKANDGVKDIVTSDNYEKDVLKALLVEGQLVEDADEE